MDQRRPVGDFCFAIQSTAKSADCSFLHAHFICDREVLEAFEDSASDLEFAGREPVDSREIVPAFLRTHPIIQRRDGIVLMRSTLVVHSVVRCPFCIRRANNNLMSSAGMTRGDVSSQWMTFAALTAADSYSHETENEIDVPASDTN